MKLLHTADWQLGARVLQAGPRASDVRKRRLKAAENAVDVALSEDVDLVLLAGDTFESHDVDDSVVRAAVRLLDQLAPIPVYVLPGNHDPYVAGGVWDRLSWRRAGEHVHLLTEPAERLIGDDLALYPCPLMQKRSPRDPTGWIPGREEGDERIRIGVAHGTLDILPGDTPNFPIAADRAGSASLDYLALGDWHGYMKPSSSTAYSGTIEPTGYAEEDPGWVVIVEVDEAGAEPRLRKERVATLEWVRVEVAIRDVTDVRAVEERLGDRSDWPDRLVRLRLELLPDCTDDGASEFAALRAELEEACLLLDCQVEERAREGVSLPEGVPARTDEILATVLDGRIPDGVGRAVSSEPEAVVSEARALLHRLAAEVDR